MGMHKNHNAFGKALLEVGSAGEAYGKVYPKAGSGTRKVMASRLLSLPTGMSMSVEQKATMGEVRLMIRVIDSYNKIGQKPTLSNFKYIHSSIVSPLL